MLPKNLAKINDQIIIDWSVENLDFSPQKNHPETNRDNPEFHLVSVNCLALIFRIVGKCQGLGFLLGG